MVKTLLVVPDVELGEALLRTLDEARYPVTVALWLLRREEWTLIASTPLYARGAKEAYLRLYAALASSGPALNDLPVRLYSNRDPLIKGLRKMLGKTKSVEGMRLGGHSIGGVWIEDGYVYRIK
jgi:hypothetical protein